MRRGSLALGAETHSSHPIAQSIANAWGDTCGKSIDAGTIGAYEEIAEKGVSVRVGEGAVFCGKRQTA